MKILFSKTETHTHTAADKANDRFLLLLTIDPFIVNWLKGFLLDSLILTAERQSNDVDEGTRSCGLCWPPVNTTAGVYSV